MRLRRRQTASVVWRLTYKRFLQTGLQVLFVSALLLLVRPIYEMARESFNDRGVISRLLPVGFWIVFGVVLLAPLIAIWRNISALAMILAEAATTGAHPNKILRSLLERALSVMAFLVLTAWLVALLPTGWSLLGAAGGVLLALIIIAAVFWRRFVQWHSHIEIELREQLNRASQVTAASAWSDTLPLQSADWAVEIDEITLPIDSTHAGRTLAELALRNRFGCSVVGIDRQGFSIVNPDANLVLYPHDKLLLLGGRDGLVRAGRELLSLVRARGCAV
jgi:CPA2 family monovalent cation:H+ antiporter-2